MAMDAAALAAVCKEHRLYQTPALNDRLYANFKGFTALGGLEAYTGLRTLFLEGNALESPAGLPPLPELRCLFLQQNGLTSLAPPTLAALPQLDTLNLGGNALQSLEGLEGCAALHTLVAADNQLADGAPLAALATCTALESLDLSGNRLEDGPALLALLARLPALKCLYLRGNPLVSSLRSYRKAMIAALPGLTYLDDRPVFDQERQCAEAWARGGVEAERQARAAHQAREREAERRRVAALREVREAGWRKRREALGLDPAGGDPDLEGLTDEAALAAYDESRREEEPEELRRARERLAAYTAGRAPQDEGLPGLVEADVQAVLEESRASQAALLAGTTQPATPENSCPNSGTSSSCWAAAACAAPPQPAGEAAAGGAPAAAVPDARQTVHIGNSCASGQATGGGAHPAPEAQLPQEEEGAGGAGSDSEGSASVAASDSTEADSDDEEEDCLETLD